MESKRIDAQATHFLYSVVSDDRMGSLAIDRKPEAYVAFGITPSLKKLALEELADVFDIRYSTLFPDSDGFGHANSFRYYEYETQGSNQSGKYPLI